jgi:hypothetical protein
MTHRSFRRTYFIRQQAGKPPHYLLDFCAVILNPGQARACLRTKYVFRTREHLRGIPANNKRVEFELFSGWEAKLYLPVAKSICTRARPRKSTPRTQWTGQFSNINNLIFHEKECYLTVRTTACVTPQGSPLAAWQHYSLVSTVCGKPNSLILSRMSCLTKERDDPETNVADNQKSLMLRTHGLLLPPAER